MCVSTYLEPIFLTVMQASLPRYYSSFGCFGCFGCFVVLLVVVDVLGIVLVVTLLGVERVMIPPSGAAIGGGMSKTHVVIAALTLALFCVGFGETKFVKGAGHVVASSRAVRSGSGGASSAPASESASSASASRLSTFRPSLNASEMVTSAESIGSRFAASADYEAWRVFAAGSGAHLFTRDEMLRCMVSVGGLGIIGDSTVRELSSGLLEFLGRNRIPVLGVKREDQRSDDVWPDVKMEDGSIGVARFRYRFAKNTWPELASRAEEITLPPNGARAVLVHSGFWDFDVNNAGLSDTTFFSVYVRRVAKFLTYVRDELGPKLDDCDAEEGVTTTIGKGLAPRRWLWRTTNPSFHPKLDEGRKEWQTTGRVALLNEFSTAAIVAAGEADTKTRSKSTLWELYDAWKMMPPELLGREIGVNKDIIAEDGYHPSRSVSTLMAHRLMNQLCGKRIGSDTLEGLAASMAD